MKDLGDASYALGIRIYRDRSRKLLGLSQSTYIDKVLARFSMSESKRGSLPMVQGTSLSKTQGASTPEKVERMINVPYASAIGSIMYSMVCTRHDVAFALSVTSRYQSNPGEIHWTAVKNILKYFRRTKDSFLVYGGKEELSIVGYTDASFQTDRDDFKSQAGYVFCLNGGAVTWKSYKQDTTADSTTEAEYMAAAEAAKEGVWLKNFIIELGVVPSIKNPIPLFCDNNGAIAQAKEPRSHQKTKHIVRRYHIIREIVPRGDVEICKIGTDDNIADPLTKALGKPKHESHTWFEVPKQIISENGTQFKEAEFQNFLKTWGIQHTKVSVAYPQANAQVENVNRTIISGIKKKLLSEGSKWVDELPRILWTYRTTPRRATGDTLFGLAYGFEARAPAETVIPTRREMEYDLEVNEQNQAVELNFIQERRDEVRIWAENYRRQVKSYFGRRVKPRAFQVGDYILRKREKSQPTKGGKLAKKYEGPYIIKAIVRPGWASRHFRDLRRVHSLTLAAMPELEKDPGAERGEVTDCSEAREGPEESSGVVAPSEGNAKEEESEEESEIPSPLNRRVILKEKCKDAESKHISDWGSSCGFPRKARVASFHHRAKRSGTPSQPAQLLDSLLCLLKLRPLTPGGRFVPGVCRTASPDPGMGPPLVDGNLLLQDLDPGPFSHQFRQAIYLDLGILFLKGLDLFL
ncbi:unnamed protein product [Cuscuta campestris]|uniref:Integrase catalytic domain-containing protein n=1 Tax=Cuscuta campestris TaxID=132261 RepID=A0A484LSI5_9ASTE|nr:unnamed protein product [Cuscuta campestris]